MECNYNLCLPPAIITSKHFTISVLRKNHISLNKLVKVLFHVLELVLLDSLYSSLASQTDSFCGSSYLICVPKVWCVNFLCRTIGRKMWDRVFPLVNPCIVSGRLLLFSSPQLVHVQKHSTVIVWKSWINIGTGEYFQCEQKLVCSWFWFTCVGKKFTSLTWLVLLFTMPSRTGLAPLAARVLLTHVQLAIDKDPQISFCVAALQCLCSVWSYIQECLVHPAESSTCPC